MSDRELCLFHKEKNTAHAGAQEDEDDEPLDKQDQQLAELEDEGLHNTAGKEIVKYEVDKGNADLKKLLPRLKERASEMGFTIVDKDQTGNCMFYSLSDQLELVEKRNISPKELRHSLVDYLREKMPELCEFIDRDKHQSLENYLMEMEEDGRWGDHFILQAAADLYETTIHLVDCESRNRDVTIMPREGSSKHSKLMLGHIHELHYVSLRPKLECLSGSTALHLQTQRHLDDINKDPNDEENEKDTIDEEERGTKETTAGENKSPKHSHKKGKNTLKPPSSRASIHLDTKAQQMMAELQRLKSQMIEFRHSIHRPPVRPFTPDIFNSLSPYYNQYLVNCAIQDLQEELTIPRGYGHRPTALGVVDPEVAWKMDNFPNPVQQSRLPGRLFHAADWSRNRAKSRNNQGSTTHPSLPMPSFPKFNQSNYQPNKMSYDDVVNLRHDLSHTYEKRAKKQAKVDYERTVQDWHRMNLSELKKLPPSPRYHIKEAIVSYLGTSRGSSRAIKLLTKELKVTNPKPIAQP